MRKVIVKDEIFELYPDFYRGIIVVSGLTNHPSLKRVRKLLKKEIDVKTTLDIAGEERLLAWDEAHKKFGSNPGKYPPSIKSLLKRIKKNPALPYINTVVALFNYISLKYCLPCGGDDMEMVEGDFVLGFAEGDESFQGLGSDSIEPPEKGEVIYSDGATGNVMCRRWNWRNGDRTKIEATTEKILINIDCLPPHNSQSGAEARDELAALLVEHCGAVLLTDELHREKRQVDLQF